MSRSRIFDWLRQFQTDELIEAALKVINTVRLVGRSDIDASVRRFVDRFADFKGGSLCPLGEPKDSAAPATYYAAGQAAKVDIQVRSLSDALASEGPIIFLDDFIGTGSQAITILETWLDVPLSFDLHEQRGSPLPAELRKELLARRTGFVFAAGWSNGAAALEQRAGELGFHASAMAGLTDEELPKAFDCGLFGSEELEQTFRAKCESIGQQLLKDDPKVTQRVLGYGNTGQLVVLPYNTPTQTLTCLWKSGVADGAVWTPLFPRRPKR